ncbi:RNA ligase/cyclic nucleotide phosphodiesterase family protein [Actinidia rufa]|uniref:RNA ligase/cyclic nucleotide phosphodiesterase family protein n=1 Tax=Actinidia rufa TaxID=165716 RepID=A0A7J0ENL2_9ERIC|nr:RNA ligase/cyclic nucleotide phosphodiesterase family protein [Actinidia rufa]
MSQGYAIELYFDPALENQVLKAWNPYLSPQLEAFQVTAMFFFLAPTPSMPLLQFHSQLCDAMRKEGIEIVEEYRPGSWIPYCPVAEEVPKSRMAEAFTVLRDLKLPVTGYAMDIGLVEYSPVRELFSVMLGNTFEA